MENKILYQINSTLKSIVLKNQTINLLDSNLVNGLKFHKNKVSFTLELLPEQLKESQEIKNIIENLKKFKPHAQAYPPNINKVLEALI